MGGADARLLQSDTQFSYFRRNEGHHMQESSSDFIVEALTDLWMHQNSLMWDRLNTLGVLQVGFLGGVYAVSTEKWAAPLVLWAMAALVFLTLTLWHRSDIDRCVRDKHGDRLRLMGVEVGLDMTDQSDLERWAKASYLARLFNHLHSKVYFSIIYVAIMIFDSAAAIVLAFRPYWHS
jgi:hypothetical protein